MDDEPTSEAWEDLGYSSKKESKKNERPSPYQNLKPIAVHQHEPEELTAERKLKRLESIFKIAPESSIDASGQVSTTIQNKKFEFWPSSDTYFIHSTGKYGCGIDHLCDLIQKKLLNRQSLEEEKEIRDA